MEASSGLVPHRRPAGGVSRPAAAAALGHPPARGRRRGGRPGQAGRGHQGLAALRGLKPPGPTDRNPFTVRARLSRLPGLASRQRDAKEAHVTRMRSTRVTVVVATIGAVLALAGSALAAVPLTTVSTDPYTNSS